MTTILMFIGLSALCLTMALHSYKMYQHTNDNAYIIFACLFISIEIVLIGGAIHFA